MLIISVSTGVIKFAFILGLLLNSNANIISLLLVFVITKNTFNIDAKNIKKFHNLSSVLSDNIILYNTGIIAQTRE